MTITNNKKSSTGNFFHHSIDDAKVSLLQALNHLMSVYQPSSRSPLTSIYEIANSKRDGLHDKLMRIQLTAARDLPFTSSKEQQILGILSTYKPKNMMSIQSITQELERVAGVIARESPMQRLFSCFWG